MPPAPSSSDLSVPQTPSGRRFKTLRVIAALMLRELESSDSRTSLGFLWAIIDPIATITLMSVVFSIVSRSPALGTNFPLFYMTGVVPFGIYATLAAKSSGALRFNKNLLSFPSVKPIDAIFARFLLNFFVEIAVFLILTYVIVTLWSLDPHIKPMLVIQAILMASVLGLGVGCFNAVLFLMVPTYDNVWSIITRPLMLASGVLFPIAIVPEPYATWLWWNPIAHPVELMRAAFYPEATTANVDPIYVVSISVVAFAIGMVMLHSHVRDAMEN